MSDELPADLVDWVGATAGGTITSVRRVPGGASREAWFVDVETAAGVEPLFLRYSRQPTPPDSIFHPLQVEGEIFRALAGTEVTVPRVLAVHDRHEAILAERVPGDTWFYRITDPDEQVRVAQDFIRNLAALHRLDPRSLDLPSLGPVRSPREHALAGIARMRERATGPHGIDPLVRISLDWLEQHVPDHDGPSVLVQGDTGPGNFMYADGRVTAVVDWELAHFGDPMIDIAWLSLRTVQDTFTHFPDRIAEYEQLSGIEVDPARVWYYRLYAETQLASNRPFGGWVRPEPADAVTPQHRDIGNPLIYGVLHQRLTLEALARVIGLDLPPLDPPTDPPVPEWHHRYDEILGALLATTPRISDPLAAGWTKGVARVVRYLKETDRLGDWAVEAEREDLVALLGAAPEDLHAGRRALAERNQRGEISDEEYVAYRWRAVQREAHLARTASGALHHRTWPPLTDDEPATRTEDPR